MNAKKQTIKIVTGADSSHRLSFLHSVILSIALPAAALQAAPDHYPELPPLTLLATTANQHAVLMQDERQLLTLALDDKIPGLQLQVVEILSDRLVLRQAALDDDHAARLVWLHLVTSPAHASRVSILDRSPPQQRLRMQPSHPTTSIITLNPAQD